MKPFAAWRHRRRSRGVDYLRRRLVGTVAVVAIFWASLGGVLTLAFAIYPVRSGGFPVVPRPPYIRTNDPITVVEVGVPPNVPFETENLDTVPRDPSVRLIAVRPGRVTLVAGGSTVRNIETPFGAVEIGQLADVIADPDWIERSGPKKVVLKSALVSYPGVKLTVGPAVGDLELLNRLGVFLGANGGGLFFEGVHVHATGAQSMGSFRPFILSIGRGDMQFRRSTVEGLGWDWNGSYGVSWQDGSTGKAIDSTFQNNFIGVYTAQSSGLLFQRCTFRKNYLYGLDPHTYSRHLMIEDSLAEDNGAHGFIFSEYVRESVIRNSISRGNGENGIMMDTYSTGNLIYNNQVIGNVGDGVVTTDSPRNSFQSNVIEGNRVGVRTSRRDARSTVFQGNDVSFNDLASENLEIRNGHEGNSVAGNGGQWNPWALKAVWVGIAVALALSAALLSLHARKWRAKSSSLPRAD